MSINLTDEIEVKTKKGKLGAAKQIFLEGDTLTVLNEIQNINSRHNDLISKHESLSSTVSLHTNQIENNQSQITANKSAQDAKNASLEDNIKKLNTRDDQITETLNNIAATGGASIASTVTYNNATSNLVSANVLGAIDELQDIKIDKTSILQESGESEDKVMSQKATTTAIADEVARAKAAEEAIIYDVSACNSGVVFESLSALLSSSNLSTLIPTSVRHGGMTIRFIQGSEQSSDNKYVQYRLMATSFSTTVNDWQGIDDKPTVGSNNLVKSGGVVDILQDKDAIKLTSDSYYLTSDDVTQISSWHNLSGTKSCLIQVSPGDKFEYRGISSNSIRCWAMADSNKNIIDRASATANYREQKLILTIPEGISIIVFNFFNWQENDGVFSVSDKLNNTTLKATEALNKVDSIIPIVRESEQDIDTIKENLNTLNNGIIETSNNYIEGYRLNNNGLLVQDINSCVTDFAETKGYTKINFYRRTTDNGLICFYDQNKEFIDGYDYSITTQRTLDKPILANATYFRMDFGISAENPMVEHNAATVLWKKEEGRSLNVFDEFDNINNEINLLKTDLSTAEDNIEELQNSLCDIISYEYSNSVLAENRLYSTLVNALHKGERYMLEIVTNISAKMTIQVGENMATSYMRDNLGEFNFESGKKKIIFNYVPSGDYPIVRLSVANDYTLVVKKIVEFKEPFDSFSTRSKVYGIEIDNSLENDSVTRIADAKNLHNNYAIGRSKVHKWANDFDNIFPWCDMRLCNVNVVDGLKDITYEGEPGFSRTGSNGAVMVEIPKFYSYRSVKGDKEHICISGEKKSGFNVEPVFIDKDGNELDHVYCGVYLTSVEDNKLTSKTGVRPTTSYSIDMYRAAEGEMYDLAMLQCIQKLISIEFGEINVSKILGGLSHLPYNNVSDCIFACTNANNVNGGEFYVNKVEYPQNGDIYYNIDYLFVGESISVRDTTGQIIDDRKITSLGDIVEYTEEGVVRHKRYVEFDGDPVNLTAGVTRIYCYAQLNGMSDSMNYHTGRAGITDNHEVDQFRYRNIEGLWGNCGEYTDGLIMKNLKYYFTFNPSNYGDINNYTMLSYEGQGDSTHKYNWKYIRVKRMGFDRRFPTLNLPCEITGWNSNPEPYYGDVMTAYKDTDYFGKDITDTEFVCISSLGWDGGYANGPYCYRFWQKRDNAQWLYSTRMIYRSL